MTKNVTHLFEVEVNKDVMWETYLESFTPEHNKIFRKGEQDGNKRF